MKSPSRAGSLANIYTKENIMYGLIHKIINFSFVDGPGNRMVIFLQGCNFRCINCHNPQTINLCNNCGVCIPRCPARALSFEDGLVKHNSHSCTSCDLCLQVCPNNSTPRAAKISVEQLMDRIFKIAPFIQGITVSGGEATTQVDFVAELFKKVKEQTQLTTFLDTNGFLSASQWEKIIPYVDGVMLDIKAYSPGLYNKITDNDGNEVFKSAELLSQHKKLYEVRTVIIPGLTDSEAEITSIAKFIKDLDKDIIYKLLVFRNHGVRGELSNLQSPSREAMKSLEAIARSLGLNNVEIKGQ